MDVNTLKIKAYDLLKEMNQHLDEAEKLKQKIIELDQQISLIEVAPTNHQFPSEYK